MIAVVVAAPPTRTHLWFHMFKADQLAHTHMTGFMVKFKIYRKVLTYTATMSQLLSIIKPSVQ